LVLWELQPKTIDYLLKQFWLDTEPVFLGEIYPIDLEIFEWFILVLVAEIKKVYGKGFFPFWQGMLIMNMP
jgi:hypothetical protein